MSEYQEYRDKANGVGQGKHAKGGDSSGSGDGCGEMVIAPIALVIGAVVLIKMATGGKGSKWTSAKR